MIVRSSAERPERVASAKRIPSQERIEALRERVYKPVSIEQYSFLQRLFIRSASLILYYLIYAIGLTMRWEAAGAEGKRGGADDDQPIIYVFWHNRILPATLFFRKLGIVVMTSQSYDGEIIARLIQRFGYGASRGSATRGGTRSLREMAGCLGAGFDAAFTIDGPKGPIYAAKPGAVQLAKLSGCPVLPVCQTPSRCWELNSWDRFLIPKPFSRGLISYAPFINVPRDCDETAMESKQAELQSALDRLHRESDNWRNQFIK